MRINYMITAYSQPKLLERVIRKLQHPDAWFYIHVDAKVDIEAFRNCTSELSQVRLLEGPERIWVEWGDISMVQAELNLIRAVLRDTQEGYVILMSGQDYPIKPTQYIHDYLKGHYPTEFIHAFPVEDTEPHIRKIMNRHSRWHWVTVRGKFKVVILPYRCIWFSGRKFADASAISQLLSRRMIGKCIRLFFQPKRSPEGLHIHAAETWYEITTQTAARLVEIVEGNPALIRYYSTFGLPEESMPQSIILSYLSQVQGNVQDILVWINRERKNENGCPIPMYIDLTIKDRNAILSTIQQDKDKLFARKLTNEQHDLLDWIDRYTS